MGKFDGMLICTDLDGTLLRKDKSVSRENMIAILITRFVSVKSFIIIAKMIADTSVN